MIVPDWEQIPAAARLVILVCQRDVPCGLSHPPPASHPPRRRAPPRQSGHKPLLSQHESTKVPNEPPRRVLYVMVSKAIQQRAAAPVPGAAPTVRDQCCHITTPIPHSPVRGLASPAAQPGG